MSKNYLSTLILHASRKTALRGLSLAILGVVALLLLPCRLTAQIDAGGVTGTVHDATGAVVVGAQVTLTNDETSVKSVTKSTSTGTYVFDAVKPGTYTIAATAAGFEKYITHDIIVHVQQVMTVDIALVPGNVNVQVEVTTSAPLLQAENAAVGQTVDTMAVNDLPLNGRDWVSLGQLSAGVATAPVAQPSTNGGSQAAAYYSVNGANLWQNDIRLNGINDNIEMYGGSKIGTNATITPPPDAVEEFKLQSGDFNAEFGHSTGGVVNAVTKSGTNTLRGDLWEYVRNDDLQANDYFTKLAHRGIPEFRQNQYGGTLGGPVRFGKLYDGRNKTFFFLAFQALTTVEAESVLSPSTSLFFTVPSNNMQSSGFTNMQDLINLQLGSSATTDALGRSIPYGTILDPATTRTIAAGAIDPISGLPNNGTSAIQVRDPFYSGGNVAGITNFGGANVVNLNMLPAGRMNALAVKQLGLFPLPNVPCTPATGVNCFNNSFFNNPKLSEKENQGDGRLDQTIGTKDTFFIAGDYSHIIYKIPPLIPGAIGETNGQNQGYPAYAIAAGYNHIFTPTLINEFHAGYDHFIENVKSIYGNTMGIPAQYGIQGIPQVPNNGGLPPTTIGGIHNMGVGNYTPTLETIWALEVMDNVTKIQAGHTFKVGFQVDDLKGNIIQPPSSRGNFTYNGMYTDVVNHTTGETGMADMILNPIPTTVAASPGVTPDPWNVGGLAAYNGSNYAGTDDHRWYMGGYAQDDWKVTNNLTLNLGARWDLFTPYAEINGRQANLVLGGGGNGTPGATTQGTYYMPNEGCKVARAAAFDTLLAKDGITLVCTGSKNVGKEQKDNFSPRIGFAYHALPKLVIRGGYGIAYGALANIGYGGTLGQNYPFIYNIANLSGNSSTVPLTIPGSVTAANPAGTTATQQNIFGSINLTDATQITGQGVSLYGRQYNYKTPYIQTFNFTGQYELTAHDSVQAGYVGALGRHLDDYYNTLNSPEEILPVGTSVTPYLPLPDFAANTTYETTNSDSSYNALQTTYQHQVSMGLTLLANYTWSKCMSNQKTQAKATPNFRAAWLPGFGTKPDYTLCDSDAKTVVHVAGTYELPVGKGRMFASSVNHWEDMVIGGWDTNFIYTFQSGQPFNVACATSTTADFGCNANINKGVSMYSGAKTQLHWVNAAAFATPPVAKTIGQLDFSPLGTPGMQARGPHFTNVDASLFKNFTLPETFRLQFRAEAFNLFNNAQFAQPSATNYTSSNFGQITALRNPSRELQLALKLFF
jgi:hypothetical protein